MNNNDLVPTPSTSKVCRHCGSALSLTKAGHLVHKATRSAFCGGGRTTKAERMAS